MSTVGDYQTSHPGDIRLLPPFSQDEIYDQNRLHHCPGMEPPLSSTFTPAGSMPDLLVISGRLPFFGEKDLA